MVKTTEKAICPDCHVVADILERRDMVNYPIEVLSCGACGGIFTQQDGREWRIMYKDRKVNFGGP